MRRVLQPNELMGHKPLIVIATYNERENLPTLLERIAALVPSVDVLVIDDASPDGTGELADTLAVQNPSIHVLHRASKQGLSRALEAGFRWGLERGYEQLVNIDGDLSHNPADIPLLLAKSEEADLVIGSRYLEGIRVINWPPRRLLLSMVAARYVRWITRMPVCDPTSGFRCFRASALAATLSELLISRGYSFHIELAYKMWARGMKVVETPIVFTDRLRGVTKLNYRIITEACWIPWRLLAWRMQRSEGRGQKAENGHGPLKTGSLPQENAKNA